MRDAGFLMMPFDDSLEWLRELVVEAGEALGVRVERADEIFSAGIVIEQIRDRIRAADVVIAICTGQNPNVFFELGIADQWHWPILLAERSDDLPFDVQHYRTLIYGKLQPPVLSKALQAAIDSTLQAGKKDRPGLRTTDRPPRSEPRVLGQFMMQVHVWGLEREGSLEHFPVDVLFLVQDLATAAQGGTRPLQQDFPKRQGVMANPWDVLEAAEHSGLIQKNYDPDNSEWYLVLTHKGGALLSAYQRFSKGVSESPAPSDSTD